MAGAVYRLRNHRHLDDQKDQRLQQAGAVGAGGLRLRPVLLRPHPRDEHHSGRRCLLAVVRLWYRRRHDLLDDPL